MHTQFEEVVRMKGDLLALQETRLSELAQIDMSQMLAEHGWCAIWGKPMQPQKRKGGFVPSAYNARHGGVAVIVRKGVSAKNGPIDTPVRQRLWNSGRWVHAIVTFGEARNALHVFSIYGFPNAELDANIMRQNEPFLHDVLEADNELGNVPIAICGDFNIVPSSSFCHGWH